MGYGRNLYCLANPIDCTTCIWFRCEGYVYGLSGQYCSTLLLWGWYYSGSHCIKINVLRNNSDEMVTQLIVFVARFGIQTTVILWGFWLYVVHVFQPRISISITKCDNITTQTTFTPQGKMKYICNGRKGSLAVQGGRMYVFWEGRQTSKFLNNLDTYVGSDESEGYIAMWAILFEYCVCVEFKHTSNASAGAPVNG